MEKLIEETKQVTVMVPKIVPEERVVPVFPSLPSFFRTAQQHAQEKYDLRDVFNTRKHASHLQQVPMQRMVPQQHTIMVPRTKMVPVRVDSISFLELG